MSSPLAYADYYLPQTVNHHRHHLYQSPYSSQSITLHHPHEHPLALQMQQPPSPSVPIDPALALYPPQYYGYPQHPQHMPPPHLTLPASLSSPSSHGSETVGTPPNDTISFSSNANGKRPSSSASFSNDHNSKRARQDDDGEAQSPSTEKGDEAKAKPTRGARYVLAMTRLCIPLTSPKSMYRLPPAQNEVRRSRERSTL